MGREMFDRGQTAGRVGCATTVVNKQVKVRHETGGK